MAVSWIFAMGRIICTEKFKKETGRILAWQTVTGLYKSSAWEDRIW